MKNTRLFIFITALLITLLMVVGCDVSPVSENADSDLVMASIRITSSRSLTNGQQDSLSKVSHFVYNTEPMWKIDGNSVSESIHGIADDWYSALPDNGEIGWVTPGLWKVSIYGFNEGGVVIYYGETEVYFSSSNTSATVYMSPYAGKEDIEIDILQPMLSADPYDYIYVYRLFDSSGKIAKSNGNDVVGVINIDADNSNEINGNYKALISGVDCGKYSLGVYCYKNTRTNTDQIESIENIGELVGGEVKTIFLYVNPYLNQNFKISGTLDFSDFVKGQLDISLVIVSGSISHDYNTIDTEITFTLKDSTMADSEKNNYNITYDWYVNGVKESDQTTETEFNYKFSTYGPKEVSCVVTYQHKELTERVYTATIKDSFTITP